MKRVRYPAVLCSQCGLVTWDEYMVTDEVWQKAGMKEKGFLHWTCLGIRLGRSVCKSDLANVPLNHVIKEILP